MMQVRVLSGAPSDAALCGHGIPPYKGKNSVRLGGVVRLEVGRINPDGAPIDLGGVGETVGGPSVIAIPNAEE